MDRSTVLGILIALVGIIAGLLIEGGNLRQILQPTAAMIVMGGTFGAVMVQFPLSVVWPAFLRLKDVFVEPKETPESNIAQLVKFAVKARRDGIVALDADLARINDPFLKKCLMLAIDGTEPQELRTIMEVELDTRSDRDDEIPRVYESAGGFAPTIGIIGAVLGLIQVMQHLDNISEVGKGIAVAFVATVYGVGSANIFFLPAAGKLKSRMREEQLRRELTVEGVASILEGMNPRILETKLSGFLVKASENTTRHNEAQTKATTL